MRRLLILSLLALAVVAGPSLAAQAHVPSCQSKLWTPYPPSPCTTPEPLPPAPSGTPVTGGSVAVPSIAAGLLALTGGAALYVRLMHGREER